MKEIIAKYKSKIKYILYFIFLSLSLYITINSILETTEKLLKNSLIYNYNAENCFLTLSIYVGFPTFINLFIWLFSSYNIALTIIIILSYKFSKSKLSLRMHKLMQLVTLIIIFFLYVVLFFDFIGNSGFDSVGR